MLPFCRVFHFIFIFTSSPARHMPTVYGSRKDLCAHRMHRAVPLTSRASVAMAPKRKLAVAAAAPKAAKTAKAKPALVPADDSVAARADLTIEHW